MRRAARPSVAAHGHRQAIEDAEEDSNAPLVTVQNRASQATVWPQQENETKVRSHLIAPHADEDHSKVRQARPRRTCSSRSPSPPSLPGPARPSPPSSSSPTSPSAASLPPLSSRTLIERTTHHARARRRAPDHATPASSVAAGARRGSRGCCPSSMLHERLEHSAVGCL